MRVHAQIDGQIDRFCGGSQSESFLQPQNKCDFNLAGSAGFLGTHSPPGGVDIELDNGRTFSFRVNFNPNGSNSFTVDDIQCNCSYVTCQIYKEAGDNSGNDSYNLGFITVSIYSTSRNAIANGVKPPSTIDMRNHDSIIYTIVNNKIDK